MGGLFDMMIAGQISETGGIGVRDMVDNWLADRSAQQISAEQILGSAE